MSVWLPLISGLKSLQILCFESKDERSGKVENAKLSETIKEKLLGNRILFYIDMKSLLIQTR